ncbi:MAG: hypothetical protein KIT80_23670 [Chitinophagaceae bacterium]|nr:hypothetical protein [Nitrosomonas sp.]MCW5929940.1 hypothetical protein [Chitinophagaceae bacterium]
MLKYTEFIDNTGDYVTENLEGKTIKNASFLRFSDQYVSHLFLCLIFDDDTFTIIGAEEGLSRKGGSVFDYGSLFGFKDTSRSLTMKLHELGIINDQECNERIVEIDGEEYDKDSAEYWRLKEKLGL